MTDLWYPTNLYTKLRMGVSKQPCTNDPNFTHTGKEASPLGRGLAPHAFNIGDMAEGRDGTMWIVAMKNGVKVWVRIPTELTKNDKNEPEMDEQKVHAEEEELSPKKSDKAKKPSKKAASKPEPVLEKDSPLEEPVAVAEPEEPAAPAKASSSKAKAAKAMPAPEPEATEPIVTKPKKATGKNSKAVKEVPKKPKQEPVSDQEQEPEPEPEPVPAKAKGKGKVAVKDGEKKPPTDYQLFVADERKKPWAKGLDFGALSSAMSAKWKEFKTPAEKKAAVAHLREGV